MITNQTIEKKLEKLAIPEIDVHDEIMRRVKLPYNRKRYNITSRTVILASVLLLALVGSGYAYFTSISLFNDKGDQTLSIRAYDQDNKPSVYTAEELDAALERIQPGEAVAIYKQEGNPEGIVSVMEKPLRLTSLDVLRSQAGPLFALPWQDSESIAFVEGSIQHHVGEPDIAQLQKQSITNEGQIAALLVNVEEEITGVTVRALVEGESVSASITEAKRWGTYYTDLSKMSTIGKVNIRGAEGLLSTNESGTELVWRSGMGNSGLFYRISAESNSPHTEAKLMAMLEWLLQVK
ncbi:hypothetical protein [Paenibacillus contaminans]|uniref:DUF4367 domain-containing protein n=1 Tax=Paenibacillus contaminans TaxID=450362 RepID=A0A329MLA4_9BACL|nr:hypothetical protein [Paenibacillus contaminans]RAV19493.1 hypothetical protein DQG23_21130 [Paenibacillus contaminans]